MSYLSVTKHYDNNKNLSKTRKSQKTRNDIRIVDEIH